MENPYLSTQREQHALMVSLKGDWVLENVPDLETALDSVAVGDAAAVTFECGGLQRIDVAGAWVLFRKSQAFDAQGRHANFRGFKAAHFKYLDSISAVNLPPQVTLVNVTATLPADQDTSAAIKVADIVVTDDDRGTNTLSLSGADAALFEIVDSELRLIAGAHLDDHAGGALDVEVEVDDVSIGASPDDMAPLSIRITPANRPPTVSLANVLPAIAEDADTATGVKIADIVVADDGVGRNELSLSGADVELFEIVGTELRLVPGAELNVAHTPSLEVVVEVDDPSIGHGPEDRAALSVRVVGVAAGVASQVEVTPAANLPSLTRGLEAVGKSVAAGFQDVGFITTIVLQGVTRPSMLAFRETVRQVYQTGVKAIPIVSLISFLMGVVVAYQGATQLAKFGADVFVADLVTISILREMGVVMAAIMVAGRSGSAFAASLGVMKLNEELDALRVMGLNPNQVLVAPRVLGLMIALPLLTGVADIAGLAGGLLLSATVLDISAVQFIDRAADSADLTTFFVGLVKAPVFAFLIGAVGTLRGLQVTSSAEQLGRLTTTAVVQSIALIIAADAVFTFIFVRLGI